jgi:hypothetical protein
VIPRLAGEEGEVGTCLVNAGNGWEIGRSERGDQISVFWLTPETVDVIATHPVGTDVL